MALAETVSSQPDGQPCGFSLVEVMLVTALLAVILSLAVPSYQSFLMRVYRTEAISTLMRASACQERQRLATGAYLPAACQLAPTGHYRFSMSPESGQGTLSYRMTARPVGRQMLDHCGAISLDHNGFRSIENAEADISRCWSGR